MYVLIFIVTLKTVVNFIKYSFNVSITSSDENILAEEHLLCAKHI